MKKLLDTGNILLLEVEKVRDFFYRFEEDVFPLQCASVVEVENKKYAKAIVVSFNGDGSEEYLPNEVWVSVCTGHLPEKTMKPVSFLLNRDYETYNGKVKVVDGNTIKQVQIGDVVLVKVDIEGDKAWHQDFDFPISEGALLIKDIDKTWIKGIVVSYYEPSNGWDVAVSTGCLNDNKATHLLIDNWYNPTYGGWKFFNEEDN